MKFCSECGSPVQLTIPVGDHLPRYVCTHCQTIHYQNPKIIAGCIAQWQGKILLCRRAIEPRYGLWTLPAGFMENHESTREAAAREALEEANAVVDDLTLYGLYTLPHISQVYLLFRGQLRNGYAHPGDESLEVALFAPQEIPWSELAFSSVEECLRQYVHECVSGEFGVHAADILRTEQGRMLVQRYPRVPRD